MTFHDKWAGLRSNRLVVTDGNQDLHSGDFSRAHCSNANGVSIAIATNDAADVIQAMMDLDGIAKSIFFLPRLADSHDSIELLERAGSQYIYAPSGLPNTAPDTIRIPSISNVSQVGGATEAPCAETQYVFATSGTSGLPKLVSHTFTSLTQTVRENRTESIPHWGLLYDFNRFAGMQVVMQAVLSGSVLIAPSIDLPFRERLQVLAGQGCTHLSATPTLWRKILMAPETAELNLKQITLGGEIADGATLSNIAQRWPAAKVSHIFASTEAGVGFSVRDGKPGFPSEFIDDETIRVKNGRLLLKNARDSRQYLGTEANFGSDDGWIDTGDLVEQNGDRFLFAGRADGVLNIGGDKVHPEKIEAALLSLPEVSEARVTHRKSPFTGVLMIADVVFCSSMEPGNDVKSLKTKLEKTLRPTEIPPMIRIVDQLPLETSGKTKRANA